MRRHSIRALGTTSEVIEQMNRKQKGRCAICGNRPSVKNGRVMNLHIDHCHKTGKVRGLLCGACNSGLGMFKDSPKLLLEAVAYLRGNS